MSCTKKLSQVSRFRRIVRLGAAFLAMSLPYGFAFANLADAYRALGRQDFSAAADGFRPYATAGNAEAQAALGYMLILGR